MKEMKPLCIIGLYLLVTTLAWQPGQKDICNPQNALAGSLLMPHEKYCQLFYSCGTKEGEQWTLHCPPSLLFAYGETAATCAYPSQENVCPKWPCSQYEDVGRRYPDLCCSKYWECIETGKFEQRSCASGTTFEMVSEVCSPSSGCDSHKQCSEGVQIVPVKEPCIYMASDNGNPCEYRTQGLKVNRPCPAGTSFSTETCHCSVHNSSCPLDNSFIDAGCRASGRLMFTAGGLTTRSDKLNTDIQQYYFASPGFNVNNGEGVFNAAENGLIYNYFYSSKPLNAPFAVSIVFKVENTPNVNEEIVLLENRWSTEYGSSVYCVQPTLSIIARYTGTTQWQRQFQIEVTATGSNQQTSTATGSILGNENDYYKVVATFSGRLGAVVTNINSFASSTLLSDNRDMGGSLQTNRCGLALGRGLTGRIKEFDVYEGCGNFNVIL